MPFQFKKTESLDEAVRRVFHECIGKAREHLRRCERSAAVHGARKEIKKLRSILHLVRGEIGNDDYRKGMKTLRKIADGLTASRDAHVMLEAFLALVGQTHQLAEVEDALRRHCQRESRRFRRSNFAREADRMLRKTGRRLDHLKIRSAGWAAIEPGLKQSCGRGQAALNFARKHPTPENFHEWRKHVKDQWYCFQLLDRAWPAKARAMTGHLKWLGEKLGDDHDLDLLKQFVAENCDRRRSGVKVLVGLIKSRQKELREAALELGSRIYAELPAAICRGLRRDWNRWRQK
jgi:CHAD domain-containing protein